MFERLIDLWGRKKMLRKEISQRNYGMVIDFVTGQLN